MDDAGSAHFRKSRRGAPSGFFAAEAAGLRWLAAAGGAVVARPLEVTGDGIVLERVPQGSPDAPAADEFGRRLAITHDAGAGHFGIGPEDGPGVAWIGNAPLPLRTAAPPSWGAWYAEDRMLFHARRAGLNDPVLNRVAERLADGHFDDDSAPARIHGDLWSGNVLWSPTGVVLIDPAAHGGHRVTDLAMLALFGTPLLDRILAAYTEVSDLLPDGWRDLIGLHHLHPLLVHAELFGGGYAEQAISVARRYA